MASAYPLPDGAKIIKFLGIMFDGLDVKPGGKLDQSPAGGAWFGVFVSDAGEVVAMCGADAALAAALGAALSMLPAAAAKDAAKTRELTAVMVDNLREIMNICTRLVMDPASPHLKLERIYSTGTLPAAAAAFLTQAKARCDFQVQVPKYGGGVLAFLTV